MREKLRGLVESTAFERTILIVIVLNTVDLGLETSHYLSGHYGLVLQIANQVFTGVYVVEMVMKLIVYRGGYFKDGWNVFDFLIVLSTLIPVGGAFTGARIVRVLRVVRSLRLVSGIKQLRKIIMAILGSLPGIGWTVLLMMLLYYVYSIIGIELFGRRFPEAFGSLARAFETLFELTTLEGWQDLVHPVAAVYSGAWVYFLSFIIIASFVLLNVVIGVVVDTIDTLSRQEEAEEADSKASAAGGSQAALRKEFLEIKEHLAIVEALLAADGDAEGPPAPE